MVSFRVTHRHAVPAVKSPEQLAREREMLDEELEDKKLYLKKIENKCYICLIWFKNNWTHYSTYGNFCVVCSGRIIRVLFNSKQRTKTALTREESSILIAARKNFVLEHQLDLPPSKRRKKNRYVLPPRED